MLKNILKTLQDTQELVKEKATEINEAAKEKINEAKDHTREKILSIIEEWVELLPKLMSLGFEMTSFGISMSLSPCMLAELKGKTENFSEERIKELLEIHKNDKSLKLFLNVIKTTFMLHKKTNARMKDELIVRVEVKLSPEIKVFIGQPQLT